MRVAVLGGGPSGEHDVSLASAASVADGLARAGHEPVRVAVGRDGRWTRDGEPVAVEPGGGLLGCDVAFPALHGPYGEDGVVQGMLEALGVPYVGAGVAASSLCIDKVRFKDAMAVAGVAQVDYRALRAPAGWRPGEPAALSDAERAAVAELGLPVFVKPASLGSSVGISKVVAADELDAAVAAAWEHDRLAIVEAMSDGLEIECALLDDGALEVSVAGEIEFDADWYDFEAKYVEGGMRLIVPARIPAAVAAAVRDQAAAVFRSVDCRGLARCDFFVEDPDGDARILVNELNTIPGFTPTSVFPKLWAASGLEYPELLDRLVRGAVAAGG